MKKVNTFRKISKVFIISIISIMTIVGCGKEEEEQQVGVISAGDNNNNDGYGDVFDMGESSGTSDDSDNTQDSDVEVNEDSSNSDNVDITQTPEYIASKEERQKKIIGNWTSESDGVTFVFEESEENKVDENGEILEETEIIYRCYIYNNDGTTYAGIYDTDNETYVNIKYTIPAVYDFENMVETTDENGNSTGSQPTVVQEEEVVELNCEISSIDLSMTEGDYARKLSVNDKENNITYELSEMQPW